MLLFVDADQDGTTGRQGFEYVVNHPPLSSLETTLKRTSDGLVIDYVPYRVSGRRLELSIPRAAIGQSREVAFDFHWGDNTPRSGAGFDLLTRGDSAPNRRFNYRYQTSAPSGGAPRGFLDGVEGGRARGWALDPSTPSRPVTVHFYVDGPAGRGRFLGSVRADRPRSDVNRVTGHPGDHGFEFQIPAWVAAGQHTLYAYALDTSGWPPNPLLTGSPKRFVVAGARPRTFSLFSSRFRTWTNSVLDAIRRFFRR
jgi:hypothetical protein